MDLIRRLSEVLVVTYVDKAANTPAFVDRRWFQRQLMKEIDDDNTYEDFTGGMVQHLADVGDLHHCHI